MSDPARHLRLCFKNGKPSRVVIDGDMTFHFRSFGSEKLEEQVYDEIEEQNPNSLGMLFFPYVSERVFSALLLAAWRRINGGPPLTIDELPRLRWRTLKAANVLVGLRRHFSNEGAFRIEKREPAEESVITLDLEATEIDFDPPDAARQLVEKYAAGEEGATVELSTAAGSQRIAEWVIGWIDKKVASEPEPTLVVDILATEGAVALRVLTHVLSDVEGIEESHYRHLSLRLFGSDYVGAEYAFGRQEIVANYSRLIDGILSRAGEPNRMLFARMRAKRVTLEVYLHSVLPVVHGIKVGSDRVAFGVADWIKMEGYDCPQLTCRAAEPRFVPLEGAEDPLVLSFGSWVEVMTTKDHRLYHSADPQAPIDDLRKWIEGLSGGGAQPAASASVRA